MLHITPIESEVTDNVHVIMLIPGFPSNLADEYLWVFDKYSTSYGNSSLII